MTQKTKPQKTTKPTTQPETETPTIIPSLSNINEPITDLSKVLDDSAKQLQSEPPKKRGPKGPRNKDNNSPTNSGIKMDPLQYKTMLAGLITMSGQYLAMVTKDDSFNITKEEVDLLASQGSECAVDFMPAVDSKWVKLGMFTISVGSVYGIRYYNYTEKARKEYLQKQLEMNVQVNG